MNFNRARSWPHPVISKMTDDIVPNDFDFRLDVLPEYQRWILGVEVNNSDSTLKSFVEAKGVAYVLQVECTRTYFRQSFSNHEPRFEAIIPGDQLFGLVEVSLLAVATKDLDEYQHPNQHADYRKAVFSVSVGQPLAVAISKTFEAFLEADPILRLSSILDIKRGEEDQKIMKVNCENDRIIVVLPPAEFDRYRELRADPAIRGLLATTVILPALLDSLHYVRNPDLDVDEFKATHRWCRCVLDRLERMGIEVTNQNADTSICLDAAQSLLREPLRRSLEDLSGLFSEP